MQKYATRLFVYSSISFGIFGVLLVLTLPSEGSDNDEPSNIIFKLLLTSGFIVLTSFALSVAGKYLNGK